MDQTSGQNQYSVAVETSGRLGSVAIGTGAEILESATFNTTHHHAVALLPTIDELCRKHGAEPGNLHRVFVSGGPGSFTGLRLGVTFARTMAMASGTKLVRVPTLDVIAQNVLQSEDPPPHVAVILDAKRKHVFTAYYVIDGGQVSRVDQPAEQDPLDYFPTLPADCAIMGEGVKYHADVVADSGRRILPEELNQPRADIVYRLGHCLAEQGHFDEPGELIPIYVRRPEAEEVWERRQAEKKAAESKGD